MTPKQIYNSKFILVIGIVILFVLVTVKYKSKNEQREIDKEKEKLMQLAYEIEDKNNNIRKALEIINSQSSKEKIARSQLNLKKNGEVVYSFTDVDNKYDLSDSLKLHTNSNIKKWFYYFTNQSLN